MYTTRSAALVFTLLLIACGGERRGGEKASVGGRGVHGDTLTIAIIGKSSSNPVFPAAENGAEAAARDLAQKHNIHIAVHSLTPAQENAETQAERLREAVNYGADAILISASDATKLTAPINAAVDQGVEVMTFDSDAPASRRFAYYGVDDYDLGGQVMAELATLMGNKGKAGILAGNENAPNLQARARGASAEAAKHPGIQILGPFHHGETPQDATAELQRENKAHPDLKGWAMVGGWPLFGTSLLNDANATRLKIVAVDALPAELAYVEKGVVPVLLAQPVYQWGYVGVNTIIDKVQLKKDVPVIIPMDLVRVTKENLGEWARQLKSWGFTDVPDAYLKM